MNGNNMNDARYQELRESSWRRALTDTERVELAAYLASHPGAEAEWEAEVELTGALAEMKDVPVSSNFTARVLQAAGSAERADECQTPSWMLLLRSRWLPRAAVVAGLMGLGFWGHDRYQSAKFAAVAEKIAIGSSVAAVPTPDALADFDPVSQLGAAFPDEDLLAALK